MQSEKNTRKDTNITSRGFGVYFSTKNTFESTISSSLIPFSFDSIQSQIYTEQAVNGMNLPHNLIPEVTICENGYQYSISNLKLENIGIVLYLENDVRELAQCKGTYLIIVTTTNISDFFCIFLCLVYSSYCIGPCKCKCGYQGKEFLLLNLNNKYFIHYALLYEYSELMTHSRNPLFSYLK